MQGALIRVYLAWAPRTDDLAYVRRAMVNAAIDHHRRPFSRRERTMSTLPERGVTDASDHADPELIAALAALPSRMRAAVVLRHVEGLSVREAAAALGCSEGTVKSQTARGLDKLRDALARQTGSDLSRSRVDVGTTSTPARTGNQQVTDPRQGERPWPT